VRHWLDRAKVRIRDLIPGLPPGVPGGDDLVEDVPAASDKVRFWTDEDWGEFLRQWEDDGHWANISLIPLKSCPAPATCALKAPLRRSLDAHRRSFAQRW
jgi:hypothetical protein